MSSTLHFPCRPSHSFYIQVIPLCSSPFIFPLILQHPLWIPFTSFIHPITFCFDILAAPTLSRLARDHTSPSPNIPFLFSNLSWPKVFFPLNPVYFLHWNISYHVIFYFTHSLFTVPVVLLYSFYSAKTFHLVLLFLDPNCPPGHVPLCGQESKAAWLSARVWRLREAPSTRQFHV